MEKVTLTAPALKDVAGPKAEDFPTGFQMPYTHFIRTAFLSRRDDLIDGAEIAFHFSGIGTVTFRGRAYRFDFLPAYAKAKNYADSVEGSWG